MRAGAESPETCGKPGCGRRILVLQAGERGVTAADVLKSCAVAVENYFYHGISSFIRTSVVRICKRKFGLLREPRVRLALQPLEEVSGQWATDSVRPCQHAQRGSAALPDQECTPTWTIIV